jgi:hypothetical protein
MADQAVTAQQALALQMQGLAERLSILSYNLDKPPGERLPLDVSPSHIPQPPPERGR